MSERDIITAQQAIYGYSSISPDIGPGPSRVAGCHLPGCYSN